MNLDQFLKRYDADDNEWWRLSPGEMQNVFDEAVAEIERLRNLVGSSMADYLAQATDNLEELQALNVENAKLRNALVSISLMYNASQVNREFDEGDWLLAASSAAKTALASEE